MKSPFSPKGPRQTPFTRLSQAGATGNDIVGQIRRINGFENTGDLKPESTSQRQIDIIVQQTLRILEDIKNGREKHLGLRDFESIAEEVRNHLVGLNISTDKIDAAIIEARKRISEE